MIFILSCGIFPAMYDNGQKDCIMAVKMIDIAREVGVTRQAVSAVLNHPDTCRVSDEVQEKIRNVAEELGYVPNITARILKGSKSGSVGIITGSMQFGVTSSLFREIVKSLKRRGLSAIISVCEAGGELKAFKELKMRGVDGVIFLKSMGIGLDVIDLPFVMIDSAINGEYDVVVNRFSGGIMATSHLAEHGRKRIAMLAISEKFYQNKSNRVGGYQKFCREAGLPHDESMLIHGSMFNNDFDELVRLLGRLKIDALFCQNDYVAGKIIRELITRGVKVPDDIAVIGFDGMSFSDFCAVPLSTVIQPLYRQMEVGINIFMERLKKNIIQPELAKVSIDPVLYTSASCGCPCRGDQQFYSQNTYPVLEANRQENFGEQLEFYIK